MRYDVRFGNVPTEEEWNALETAARVNFVTHWMNVIGDSWRTNPNPTLHLNGGCPYGKCGGVGFYRLDVPVGHEMFGKAIPCQCKRERDAQANAARVEMLREQLSDTEKNWTLKNWRGVDDDALRAAKNAVNSGFGMYVFWSRQFGNGKSGLLAAIVNTALDQQLPARFISMPDLLDELRAGYGKHDYDLKLNEFKNIKVLALDELGFYYERSARVSDDDATTWVDEKIFQIIDHRYRHFSTLLTVCASNFEPDKGDTNRIASRLSDTERVTCVQVKGSDLRPLAATIGKRKK